MKFTIRDLLAVILAVGIHFGTRGWIIWGLLIPTLVALIVTIGLARPASSIMFCCAIGALASFISCAEMFVELALTSTGEDALFWRESWPAVIVPIVVVAFIGAAVGASVGAVLRFSRPATQ